MFQWRRIRVASRSNMPMTAFPIPNHELDREEKIKFGKQLGSFLGILLGIYTRNIY